MQDPSSSTTLDIDITPDPPLQNAITPRGNPEQLGQLPIKVSKGAKIRNRYNQVPHLTQDTNGKVTNSQ